MNIQDIAVRPASDTCWQFPAGLHGNQRETKLFATQLVKQALESGDFSAEITQCECRSVLDDSDVIYVIEESRAASPSHVMWRVRSIWTAIESVLKDSKKEQQIRSKFGSPEQGFPAICDRFAFETFHELWFALSFLDSAMAVPCYWVPREEINVWAMRALKTIVEWLPEMWFLSQRIFSDGPPGEVLLFGRHPWAGTLAVTARLSGYHVCDDHFDGKGDPIEWLILDRIIRMTSTRRFELIPLDSNSVTQQQERSNGS